MEALRQMGAAGSAAVTAVTFIVSTVCHQCDVYLVCRFAFRSKLDAFLPFRTNNIYYVLHISRYNSTLSM